MSKKPLLSESQVAKWMKLANIDKNATQNFLTENKKSNKKLVKENMGTYARNDEESPVDDMESMDDMGGMDDMGDGAMGDELSVEEPMDDMGADEGEVEFDSVDDLKTVIKDSVMFMNNFSLIGNNSVPSSDFNKNSPSYLPTLDVS